MFGTSGVDQGQQGQPYGVPPGSVGAAGPAGVPAKAARVVGAWSAGRSTGRALLLAFFGLLLVGTNTAIGYVAVGVQAVPIVSGVFFALVFVLLVRMLHRAAWLSLLALLPACFVLVGSVQFAPMAVLEQRGVRQVVTLADVEVTGKRHVFRLHGDAGPLAEPLVYQGSSPGYRVGDRLAVVTDPDGVVDLEVAYRVDSAGSLRALAIGAFGWAAIALAAGWRGHARRRNGREDGLNL